MRYITLAAFAVSAALAAAPSLAFAQLAEVDSPGAAKHQDRALRTDKIEVKLEAAGDEAGRNEVEYMVEMKTGDALVYNLEAPAGADLWHEFHGHTDTTVTFYKKADGAQHNGSLTAPFDGPHGWYFKNQGKTPVTVTVTLSGFYDLQTPPPE